MKICSTTGKRRYQFETRAKRVRLTLLRKLNDKKNHHTLQVYFCTVCGGWHVGHSEILRKVLEG